MRTESTATETYYIRCPNCNMDLSDKTVEYRNKHINRCLNSLNPRTYSTRGRGRPTDREKAEILESRRSL